MSVTGIISRQSQYIGVSLDIWHITQHDTVSNLIRLFYLGKLNSKYQCLVATA